MGPVRGASERQEFWGDPNYTSISCVAKREYGMAQILTFISSQGFYGCSKDRPKYGKW